MQVKNLHLFDNASDCSNHDTVFHGYKLKCVVILYLPLEKPPGNPNAGQVSCPCLLHLLFLFKILNWFRIFKYGTRLFGFHARILETNTDHSIGSIFCLSEIDDHDELMKSTMYLPSALELHPNHLCVVVAAPLPNHFMRRRVLLKICVCSWTSANQVWF